MAIFTWGDNPTEVGASYAFYRVIGYSDTEAASFAMETTLDRELTPEEEKAFAAEIEQGGGVIPSTVENVARDVASVSDAAGRGFFGSLGVGGWLLVGAAGLATVAYISGSPAVKLGSSALSEYRRKAG